MTVTTRAARVLDAVRPRSPGTACTVAAAVLAATDLGYAGATLLRPGGPSVVDVVVVLLLLGVAAALRRARGDVAALLCLLTHLVGVGVIVGLDLVSRDASVVGQVFFYLPVVSAAALLRPAGAALVAACAVAGEAVVVLSLLPVAVALTDLAFVGTTLLVTAGALARAGVLQDRLGEELRRRAAVDDLTGLLTRRVLDEATDSAVAAARSLTGTGTGTGTGTAFLLVDVDRFKQVNDHHGHLAGDEALRHVAGIVREHSRPHDVAARMGGDEIAVLLPGCSYPSALRRAQEVVDAVRRRPLRLPDGTVLALSVSVGAAHAPEHAASARDLYARADAALYAVKRTGRGRAGGVPVPPAPPGPAAEGARTGSAAR